MADEVKPPKDESTGAPRRPRKPRAKKPAAKKSADDAARVIAGKAGEAETQAVPPDAAATRKIPEPPTEALPTDVAPAPPAARPAPPRPPFAPVPRTVEKSGGGGRRIPAWLVIVLAAVAIAAVALAWVYTRRGGGEEFVGDWAPADGRGGGLVVSLADGDFTVAMYDESLGLLGSYPATRDGDVLTFDIADVEGENGRATATLTYDEERDVLTMRLTGADPQDTPLDYVRVVALQAAPTLSPVPSPTATATPTASATASPTGSPSPSPSPSQTDAAALDQRVVDGISMINQGILAWSAANGNAFPAPAEVSPDGAIAQYVPGWPANPYTGQPMASGSSKGDYTYEQLAGGQSYRLTGHLSGGTFTVP